MGASACDNQRMTFYQNLRAAVCYFNATAPSACLLFDATLEVHIRRADNKRNSEFLRGGVMDNETAAAISVIDIPAVSARSRGQNVGWRVVSACVLFVRKYAFEVLASGVPLAIFVDSISGSPASWDTAEMQSVPYILGIAHPTGFPFYILLGYLFSHAVPIGTVAFRINLLSALCVSGACLVLYKVATVLRAPRSCALIASLWFAVAGVVWGHAVRAEVHDVALLLCSLVVFWLLKWMRYGQQRDVLLAACALGSALATHPLALWLIPGALVALALKPPSLRLLRSAAAITGACLLIYLYIPIRSAIIVALRLDPASTLAGIHGGIFWNYNDPSTWGGLVTELTGSQFGAGHTVFSAVAPSSLQSYFWQWITMLNTAYGLFGIVLAAVGLSVLWRSDRRTAIALLVLTLAIIPFTYAYANVEGDADRYRLLTIWLVPVLMSAAAIRPDASFVNTARSGVVVVLMALWGLQTFQNNSAIFADRNNVGARPLITKVAAHIPPGSVIVTGWLDATSLAYGAYVDHSLPGDIIVSAGPREYASDYPAWLRHYRVYFVGNSAPLPLPGVGFSPSSTLDVGHTVWRVTAMRGREFLHKSPNHYANSRCRCALRGLSPEDAVR